MGGGLFRGAGGTVYRSSTYRLGAFLGLSLLLVWLALPGIGRADDDDKKKNNNETQQTTSKNKKNSSNRSDSPDLEVTGGTLFKNTFGQTSDRQVLFRVRNIGDEDAPATTARAEITGPGPAVERQVPVPALKAGGDPFYGYADLPEDCNGHSVKISVDLKIDASLSNNSVGPNKLCPEKPKAPQGQAPAGPAAGETVDEARRRGLDRNIAGLGQENTVDYGDAAIIPEHMRPGTHTVTFDPSVARSVRRRDHSGIDCTVVLGLAANSWAVGWSQHEQIFCTEVVVGQTAVKFDLGMLDQVPRKLVTKAQLTFDETPFRWTDSEGNDRFVAGCVAVLGIATVDWAGLNLDALIPNEDFENVVPSAKREWNVTDHVRRQVQYAEDQSLRYGYVLRGALEQLDGDDSTSCLSEISKVQLQVTYLVPDN
jgi:hypothetical protein